MSTPGGPVGLALPSPAELLADRGAIKSCCAVYQHPAVRWLLGGELHPGGEATTRRALELIRARPGDRLLDVASGSGASAVLAGRDFGCLVAGVEYGQEAVSEAQRAADAAGLCDRVGFTVGDAEALPFDDGEFDLLLCECSLCLFADKRRAVAEMGRVLRPGGRLAVSDVVVDRPRLPDELSGPEAAIACIGDALSLRGYEELLAGAGLRVIATESRDGDAAALAERVEDRLRGARLLGLGGADGSPLTVDKAIALAGAARRAIADGALGYAIVAAVR